MAAVQELGAMIERFETDNRRRRRISMVAVPLGAVAACLGVLMLLALDESASGGTRIFPSLVCGLGLGAFGVGCWQGWLSFTRPDEVFTLYEGGLVHSYAEKSWAIGWHEITKVTDNGRDNALHRALGGDISYYIKFRAPVGGRRGMSITSLTRDADWLGETVRQAAEHGNNPRPDAP
ncbi:hypothetical protein [Saccharopolyspora sp. 5N708]|uniref:hypothetical protein n=1 Tax=Saccharopolyspora sp. 5N708 TaxID=3457424 RepID=UPI003FD1BDCE